MTDGKQAPGKPPGADERQHTRATRHVVLSYRLKDSGAPFRMTMAKDISQRGIGFVAEIPFRQGDRVELLIELVMAGEERSRIVGEVVSCSRIGTAAFRIGVRFLNPPATTVAHLAAYADRCRLHDG